MREDGEYMTVPPQDKKNQHFVPKGYLRNFTIAGEKSHVWEYDKQLGSLWEFNQVAGLAGGN